MKKDVSIILPVYNQESHIEVIYKNYISRLNEENFSYEIIFVVNGSRDKSYEKCRSLENINTNIKAFEIKEPGWGRAVKFGIEKAGADLISYTNSARTNIDDLIKAIKFAGVDNHTVVKTNRIIRESFIRRLGSVIYNFENRYFFNTAIWDVNGTPKVFPRNIIKNMEILCDNDLIDAELMAKCRKNNVTIIEIPVYSTDRISGKSTTNLKSAFNMYFGLVKLKRRLKNE
jgi:glycosyltransferase involved in cell wall biosynthesis